MLISGPGWIVNFVIGKGCETDGWFGRRLNTHTCLVGIFPEVPFTSNRNALECTLGSGRCPERCKFEKLRRRTDKHDDHRFMHCLCYHCWHITHVFCHEFYAVDWSLVPVILKEDTWHGPEGMWKTYLASLGIWKQMMHVSFSFLNRTILVL
jgi:hypothetical protein